MPVGLEIYVVYGPNTRDYPGRYAVRRQVVHPGCIDVRREPAVVHPGRVEVDRDPLAVVATLKAARAALPPGLHRLDRDPADDPVILESWL